ncbi:uncharacterized protein LOC124947034 [Vespa velutina]|uniref:uncharacterized protein LOC124947034 n=1 Tax=Vespa velutina TaxID=202808 RepID=UPI001FB1CDAD|nr:uncharacterized protein LOC124947034 [Vespa velutina]
MIAKSAERQRIIRDLKPLDGLFQRMTIFLLKPTFMALKNGFALKHLIKKTQLNNAVASSTSTTLLQIFCTSSFSKSSNLAPLPLCQPENSSLCLNSGPCRQLYQQAKPCPQAKKCISLIPPCYCRVNTDCSDLPWIPYPLLCFYPHPEFSKQSPPKICYRKCLPLLKLLTLLNKIPAPPPSPQLPKHPKRLKCLIQSVPFSTPPLPKCPKFLKCSLQKKHPLFSPCELCPCRLSCSCFSSLCPLCRPNLCLKPLSYLPRSPLRSCSSSPECPTLPPCRSLLPCYVCLYSKLSLPCSCSPSQNIEAKYSKDVPCYPKFLFDIRKNEVQRMSTYHIKLRTIQAQMLHSRGLHSSCILLGKFNSDSEKDCKSVSEICKLKKESCSKPCKERDVECYPEKVICEPVKKKDKDKEKEEKIVCPKSCIRAGKCIITQIKKQDKMVYGPTECPQPKLVTPPICPPTADSENNEPVCNEKIVKPKKEVCTPPPLPDPPTEPISLCPCPPPAKLHPGPCPCPPHKNDVKVKPGRPCPIKDKYPCCLPIYYCPIKTTPCVRKPPCNKKKNTKS